MDWNFGRGVLGFAELAVLVVEDFLHWMALLDRLRQPIFILNIMLSWSGLRCQVNVWVSDVFLARGFG